MSTWGYVRTSTSLQNPERQSRNIKKEFPYAVIVQEAYTGTNFNRAEWQRLMKVVKKGDTIVFDSVSRMSRNAEEGFEWYEKLYNKQITLIFLKEPHINTDTFRNALENSDIKMTGMAVDYILEGVKRYLMEVAKEQIKLAFIQAEKEVLDLRQRTSEGIYTAKLNGKQIGQKPGAKLNVKKAIEAKKLIKRYSRDFEGNMTDVEVVKAIGISRNSFYKYKRELKENIGD